MKEKLSDIIGNFKNMKVLVIGDAILDTYVKGAPDRVSREAPVLVFNVDEQEHQCGGAANTAINVAALGADTYFLTVVGKDSSSRELMEVLKKHKVHTDYILRDKGRVTIAKKRITSASHQLMRIDEGTTSPITKICESEMLQHITSLHPTLDAIIVSDYGFGVITCGIIDGLKELQSQGHKILVADARDLSRFKTLKPDAVKPNYEETIKLLQIEKASYNRADQVLEYSKKLHDITGANKVAVTLDVDGVLFLEKGKSAYRILAVPQDHKRAIGAGDTFISALTLSLASKVKGEVAAQIAAAAAAVVVQKEGTVGCSNIELKAYFTAVPKYITQTGQLLEILKDLKKQGKKIVFTNGCFDIIHKGHIALLNKAREAGDVLIVGVNNDNSIRKLKGPERPINNLEDRITVLAGLQSVDYLVAFEDESPVELIKEVHPDVFVKGGNYTETSIPEAPLLEKLRCEVKIVPYIEEHSTTHIINKIRDINHEVEIEVSSKDLSKAQLN
ncbi:D-glycero-beta-D-manno-heptose 1-phosphate adenylyltransferase [Segetibacter aerophilus]|uniref:D-glycero-beta-D-manno-heptose 1-phosphate adenylyltransferase n=1 Tax=Segetibacter aerophilus TaxID=670293 RepID=A0A512B7R8_9BACT|nr:D-glycero-beta-D-manno-heptose 1-phosphate adenylyltransferase [Segetibacter aerophilus]GEO07998.1 bifunctional protein HldE [Segetibacter aerophilus]